MADMQDALEAVQWFEDKGVVGEDGSPKNRRWQHIASAIRQPQEEGLPLTQEPKYTVSGNWVVNRASGEPIPPDEPIFVFRGRDVHATMALQQYAELLSPGEHRCAVEGRVRDFADFAWQNPDRMKEPDTEHSESAPASAPDDFLMGVLVALQSVRDQGEEVVAKEIVGGVGFDRLKEAAQQSGSECDIRTIRWLEKVLNH